MQYFVEHRQRRCSSGFIGILGIENIKEKCSRFWQQPIVSRCLNLGHFWTLTSDLRNGETKLIISRVSRRGMKNRTKWFPLRPIRFLPNAIHGFQWQDAAAKINESVFFTMCSFTVWCEFAHMFAFSTGKHPEKGFGKPYKCEPAVSAMHLVRRDRSIRAPQRRRIRTSTPRRAKAPAPVRASARAPAGAAPTTSPARRGASPRARKARYVPGALTGFKSIELLIPKHYDWLTLWMLTFHFACLS